MEPLKSVSHLVAILPTVEETDNQSTQTSLSQCYECLSVVPNVWCMHCSADYCSACCKKIHKARALSSHRQIPIDEKPKECERCEKHSDEQLQYWCSCDTLICLDCQLTKQHQYHTCVPVAEAAQDIAKELKLEFKELQTCLYQTIAQGKSLKDKNTNHNVKTITRAFGAIRKIIDKYEERLKNKVRQIDAKNNHLVDNYLAFLNNKQTALFNHIRTFEKMMSNHEYTQLLKIKGILADHIVELTEEMEELELPVRTEYRVIGIHHLQESINDTLKKVQIIEQKSENYEFSILGTYAELDCKGRPCILCGKCRDWHYTDDLVSWEWIRNHRDWKDDDWKRWNENRIWEHFERRDDATCCLSSSSFHIFAACLCEDNI